MLIPIGGNKMNKDRKKLRKEAIVKQNNFSKRGSKIPKIYEVINKLLKDAQNEHNNKNQ